jgi:uncharacterized membrane protein YebE (DUF533 family)
MNIRRPLPFSEQSKLEEVSMDARKLLDALVGASSTANKDVRPDPIQDMLGMFGGVKGDLGGLLGRAFRDALGGLRDLGEDSNLLRKPAHKDASQSQQADDLDALLEKARGMLGGKLPTGALVGLAGLLLGTRSGRALTVQLAKLGGLALISGLAYRAYKNAHGEGAAATLDPAKTTDADALLFIRAMIAAMAADEHIDERERARIVEGLRQAGVNDEEAGWLDREIAKPATVEELATDAASSAKAAQVYAAARLAIEPDTVQEREFLTRLAEALKLEERVKREVDEGATGLKATA